ncbi:hypothetical protein [uncultured Winogradskyella sp.]|uniref:hypothetical protein n=1 Tax=uncultured Winogradskyella sp. TaxID=395353 RepID=UPI002633C812|nr:hypothetical protein [uncultured Winogradskyella sp.]
MKFNRLFYDSKLSFNAISKKRIVLSILLGLISALVIYSFFFVLRETDRMLFLDFENRPIIVPESERRFYNLFFAAISMLMGNSIAINFLFSRPQKMFSHRNNKRNRIMNDQNFLGFNFIHWFAKIWFLFAAFASNHMGSAFIENFAIPSVLLITVLYFDSWKTISLVLRKRRWRISLIHFITFFSLTFILSKIEVVDYKSFDEKMLAKNPTVDVPSSLHEYKDGRRNYYWELVFKMDFKPDGKVAIFTLENENIELHEVFSHIRKWDSSMLVYETYRNSPRLRANKDLPIKSIKEFELEIYDSGKYRLIYEILNTNESSSKFYNNRITHDISSSIEKLDVYASPPKPERFSIYGNRVFTDTIVIDVSHEISVNGIGFSIDNLKQELRNYVDESTIFEYRYDNNTTYQDYINVLSAHKSAVKELRDAEDYSAIDAEIHKNQFNRDEKLNKERRRIMDKYPINITERFD